MDGKLCGLAAFLRVHFVSSRGLEAGSSGVKLLASTKSHMNQKLIMQLIIPQWQMNFTS
jgi:hypothetical protein